MSDLPIYEAPEAPADPPSIQYVDVTCPECGVVWLLSDDPARDPSELCPACKSKAETAPPP